MIKSILDTDLYKFSTSHAYFSLYPEAEGVFSFTDRRQECWYTDTPKDNQTIMLEWFDQCMNDASELRLTEEEKNWCVANIPYIPQTYWEWLTTFRFEKDRVKRWFDDKGVFHCTVEDKLYKVTFYEILVLSAYSEIKNLISENTFGIFPNMDEVRCCTDEKISVSNKNGICFSEFGTRRRYSSAVQEAVLEEIRDKALYCAGTSNVHYAMKYGIKPIGTFPHEWVMFHGAVFGYKRANYLSLEDWIDVYQGDLGTALVDTYTTDSFLSTLTKKQAHLLSGFRQDSGDEIEVGEKVLAKVKSFGIDPKSKLIVFSNALDMEKAARINEHFKDKCKVSFGIGTNLTNDVGVFWKPANIVMKLVKCRFDGNCEWEECIKISDDQGKHLGSQDEVENAFRQLRIKKDGLCGA